MIQIGVIAPSNSIESIKKIEPLINDRCELVYLPYSNTTEIKEIYLQKYKFFKGIIFGGLFPFTLLKKEFRDFHIPAAYFDINEKDFYKSLSKLLILNHNLDISRILIDFIHKENNFLGLKQLLGNKKLPYYYCDNLEDLMTLSLYDNLFIRHLTLWEQGKVDLTITRTPALSNKLEQYSINHVVMYPSEESMLEKINQLLKEIDLQHLIENRVVIGNITIKNLETNQSVFKDIEFKKIMLNKSLLEYSEQENRSFIIQTNHLGFEIITTYRDLKEFTKDFTCCLILNYLSKELPFKVNSGWGIGNTIYEARTNAEIANRQTIENNSNVSYIVTENEQIIGPLGEEMWLNFSNTMDPYIAKISKQTGVSTLHIQKILAVISKVSTNELSAEDLANYLGVTLRSVYRILSKLEINGYAKVQFLQQKKLRGRPKKIYKITLGQVLNNDKNGDSN
ncbi:transcriptional regulator [Lysinibacillus xylanilyticus]|uniref:transcriptional regulator n=1 Tax=Lysinibacillus xylanilyticus TaxID=582475 RepID=UPI003D01A616